MNSSFMKRKMHVLYILLAVISLVLAGATHVRADDTVTQTAASQNARAQGKTLSTEQRDRFLNLVQNTYGRMESAILRLDNIANRLEERIAAYEAEGVDTATARASLSDAQNKLGEAKQMLLEAKRNADTALNSDTPRERFSTVRTQFTNIRDAIRSSYMFLREAVGALRDAVAEVKLEQQAAARSALINNQAPNPAN